MGLASVREAFEEWISSPPFERSIDKFPNDETKYAWPGQYMDSTVQTAWLAFNEGVDWALAIRPKTE